MKGKKTCSKYNMQNRQPHEQYKPRHRNNMIVNRYKNTEDSQTHETSIYKGNYFIIPVSDIKLLGVLPKLYETGEEKIGC